MKKQLFLLLFVLAFLGCKTTKLTNRLTKDSTAVVVSETQTEQKNNINTLISVSDSIKNSQYIITTVIEIDSSKIDKNSNFSLRDYVNMSAVIPVKKITRIETFLNTQQNKLTQVTQTDKSNLSSKQKIKSETEVNFSQEQKTVKTDKSKLILYSVFVFFSVAICVGLYLFIVNKFNL